MTAPTLADEIAALRYIWANFRDIRACLPDIDVALSKDVVASALARLEAMQWQHDPVAVRLDALEAAAHGRKSGRGYSCSCCGASLIPPRAAERWLMGVRETIKEWPVTSPAVRIMLAREDTCPDCGGELDTGWECSACGFDAFDLAYPGYLRDRAPEPQEGER